jgi:hypothetical protein
MLLILGASSQRGIWRNTLVSGGGDEDPAAPADVDTVVRLGDVFEGERSLTATARATAAATAVGSRAVWRREAAGKSSLPSRRRVTLLKRSGQKRSAVRSARVP